MEHLNTRRQGLQSTKEKPPDTYMEDKIKTNVVYFTTVEPSTTKEGRICSELCGRFPTTSSRGNIYINLMYVYDCNAILTTSINNRSDKEMIRDYKQLTGNLKSLGINPGFHFIDNKASTALNMTMTTVNIKYQVGPPSNHIANNAEREIQIFKNHFIVGMCSVDKYLHL